MLILNFQEENNAIRHNTRDLSMFYKHMIYMHYFIETSARYIAEQEKRQHFVVGFYG